MDLLSNQLPPTIGPLKSISAFQLNFFLLYMCHSLESNTDITVTKSSSFFFLFIYITFHGFGCCARNCADLHNLSLVSLKIGPSKLLIILKKIIKILIATYVLQVK